MTGLPAPAPEWVIQTEGLSKYYGEGAPVRALDSVTMAVARGEFVAVQGRSGSGKTTLLNLLGTLDRPSAGRVLLAGVDVTRLSGPALADLRRHQIGFIFQAFNLVPTLTALENVMLPLLPYRRRLPFHLGRRAQELLERVGLAERMHHLPGQLSGGEQQRVAIARALVNRPALILADEPTGNLDSRTAQQVMHLLTELNREFGQTVVMVTHDPEMARHADRVLEIRDGRLV